MTGNAIIAEERPRRWSSTLVRSTEIPSGGEMAHPLQGGRERERPRTDGPGVDAGGTTSPAGLAVDIGGTHVTGAVVEPTGQVRDERRSALDSHASASVIIETIVRCIRDVRGARARPLPVAVAIPGPFDYLRGIGSFDGVAKFASLRGVDLRTALATGCGLAAQHVRFVNDAEAFGLGEWAQGAGQGADRVVAITLGTGIGSAFVARGRCVTQGPSVPADGNIHLARIDGRPLEETVSRRALRQAYLRQTGREIDVVDIARLARAGEAAAVRTLEHGMRALGRALAPWLGAFAATDLVVGGSMAASSDLLFPPLRAQLDELLAEPPHVLAGALPRQEASLIGAAVASGWLTASPTDGR